MHDDFRLSYLNLHAFNHSPEVVLTMYLARLYTHNTPKFTLLSSPGMCSHQSGPLPCGGPTSENEGIRTVVGFSGRLVERSGKYARIHAAEEVLK